MRRYGYDEDGLRFNKDLDSGNFIFCLIFLVALNHSTFVKSNPKRKNYWYEETEFVGPGHNFFGSL